jgi:hypothetical protein
MSATQDLDEIIADQERQEELDRLDMFAAAALTGILARPLSESYEDVGSRAYFWALDMMKERQTAHNQLIAPDVSLSSTPVDTPPIVPLKACAICNALPNVEYQGPLTKRVAVVTCPTETCALSYLSLTPAEWNAVATNEKLKTLIARALLAH